MELHGDRFGNLCVVGDGLDVVVVFEAVDQGEDLLRLFALDGDGRAGDVGDLGGLDGDATGREGFLDLEEGDGGCIDLVHFAFVLHVFRPGFEGAFEEVVFGDGVGLDRDDAVLGELEGDGAAVGHVAAGDLEDLAHLGGGAGAVVGGAFDDEGDAAGAVAFVDDGVEGVGAGLAGAPAGGPVGRLP